MAARGAGAYLLIAAIDFTPGDLHDGQWSDVQVKKTKAKMANCWRGVYAEVREALAHRSQCLSNDINNDSDSNWKLS